MPIVALPRAHVGTAIQAAGLAVLISYLVAGTLIILVMWALGEMAAAKPGQRRLPRLHR